MKYSCRVSWMALVLLAGSAIAESAVSVNPTGDARAEFVAVSGTGNATGDPTCIYDVGLQGNNVCTISVAVSGSGHAQGNQACVHEYPGDLCWPSLAVSGRGTASGYPSIVLAGDRGTEVGGTCGGIPCYQSSVAENARAQLLAISLLGDAQSDGAFAVSGTGHASSAQPAGVSLSGTGPSDGAVAISGTNTATTDCGGNTGCAAVSGTGEARGDSFGLAGLGPASGCSIDGVGCWAISGGRDASAWNAVSGTGNARSNCQGDQLGQCLALSGTGNASGGPAIAPLGDASGCKRNFAFPARGYCASASGLGNAQGGFMAVSGMKNASACKASDCVAVSGTGNADGYIAIAPLGQANGTISTNSPAKSVVVQPIEEAASCIDAPMCAAISATHNATATTAISGVGDAASCHAILYCSATSLAGNASGVLATSGTGSATGTVATSATGRAASCADTTTYYFFFFLSCVALSATGPAECQNSNWPPDCWAASALGPANGTFAISGAGTANASSLGASAIGDARGIEAVSALGNANGSKYGASATGHASGHTAAVSGCDTLTREGITSACTR